MDFYFIDEGRVDKKISAAKKGETATDIFSTLIEPPPRGCMLLCHKFHKSTLFVECDAVTYYSRILLFKRSFISVVHYLL